MARGPKRHLKRLSAPRHWMLSKLGGIWAPRPSQGPHKLRECLPLTLILRDRLKYAMTRREVIMCVMRRFCEIDGRVRTDINYPVGLMDVVRINKTDEHFRLLYDTRGRFILHRIDQKEAAFKPLRVVKYAVGSKSACGRNPFKSGQQAAVPYIVTHDSRTIRYPHPDIDEHDTVIFDIAGSKITDFIKMENGNLGLVTRGANTGRIGVIEHIDVRDGAQNIVQLKDKRGHGFATLIDNVFVIGKGSNSVVDLPLQKGIKLGIIEDRAQKLKKPKSGASSKKKKSTK